MRYYKIEPIGEKNPDIISLWKDELHKEKKLISQLSQDWFKNSIKLEFSYHVKKYARFKTIYNIPKNASNAYYKFWEILNWLDIKHDIYHFDNASFPGDFIRAGQNYFEKYSWLANSLLNTDVNDRFDLYKNYPQNFVMNDEFDGNILNLDKIPKLDKKPNLYTCDVGFQFNDRMKEEEEYYEYLKASLTWGLQILDKDGILVVKMFNIFNKNTRLLISNIVDKFDTCYILKPEMSKMDNSELYLCCIGYKPDIKSKHNLYNFSPIISTMTGLQVRKLQKNRQNIRTYYKQRDIKEYLSIYQ